LNKLNVEVQMSLCINSDFRWCYRGKQGF